MQLADKTVAAAGLSCRVCAGAAGLFERDRIISRRRSSAMPVSRLNGSAVDDEDEEQQSEAALEVGALVLKCVRQHAGPWSLW